MCVSDCGVPSLYSSRSSMSRSTYAHTEKKERERERERETERESCIRVHDDWVCCRAIIVRRLVCCSRAPHITPRCTRLHYNWRWRHTCEVRVNVCRCGCVPHARFCSFHSSDPPKGFEHIIRLHLVLNRARILQQLQVCDIVCVCV
jgi:hypothetical protein